MSFAMPTPCITNPKSTTIKHGHVRRRFTCLTAYMPPPICIAAPLPCDIADHLRHSIATSPRRPLPRRPAPPPAASLPRSPLHPMMIAAPPPRCNHCNAASQHLCIAAPLHRRPAAPLHRCRHRCLTAGTIQRRLAAPLPRRLAAPLHRLSATLPHCRPAARSLATPPLRCNAASPPLCIAASPPHASPSAARRQAASLPRSIDLSPLHGRSTARRPTASPHAARRHAASPPRSTAAFTNVHYVRGAVLHRARSRAGPRVQV